MLIAKIILVATTLATEKLCQNYFRNNFFSHLVSPENFKGSRFTPDSIIPRASLGQRITDNYIEHIYTY